MSKSYENTKSIPKERTISNASQAEKSVTEDYIVETLTKKVIPSSQNKSNFTLDQLQKSYKFVAQIVNEFGGAYLPTFKLLHDEIQIKKDKQQLIEIARNVANDNLE